MNTPPLAILPVLSGAIGPNKSHSHLHQADAIAKDSLPSTTKFTLELARQIWATYPSGGVAKKTSETESRANALALHLGVEGVEGVSSGVGVFFALLGLRLIIACTIASGQKDMTLHEPLASGNGGASTGIANDAQHNSLLSERAVGELIPTGSDPMEISPVNLQLFSPNGDSTIGHSPPGDRSPTSMHRETTASQSHVSSALDDAQRIPRSDAINSMRGALMQSLHKAVRIRFPNLNVDQNKLKERISGKLTDAEIEVFMRMGKDVVEDLRRTGRLDEAKRKLAVYGEDGDDEARRTKQRVHEVPDSVGGAPSTHADVSRQSDTSAVGKSSKDSTVMRTDQSGGLPFSSGGLLPERPSTPMRASPQLEAPTPDRVDHNVSMSISPTTSDSRPPQLPAAQRPPESGSAQYLSETSSLKRPPESPSIQCSSEPPAAQRSSESSASQSPPKVSSSHGLHESVSLQEPLKLTSPQRTTESLSLQNLPKSPSLQHPPESSSPKRPPILPSLQDPPKSPSLHVPPELLSSERPPGSLSLQYPPKSPSQHPPESPHVAIPVNSDQHMDVTMSLNDPSERAPITEEHPQSHEPEKEGAMEFEDELSDSGEPRILLAKVGQVMADVLDASFDVDEGLFSAARRWAQRSKQYE